jgi:hypothetical protein
MRKSDMSSVIVVLVLLSGIVFSRHTHAQEAERGTGSSACVLSTTRNGQVITVHGEAVQEPHDLAFDIPGCRDAVLLTYAGDTDNQVSASELRRDVQLARFQKYTSSTYSSADKSICMRCMKYGDVEAILTGMLEIASVPPGMTKDPAGFLRDASGKVVGKWGWGHPVPFARYRLVIQSVSEVKARKISRPAASNKSSGT